jgi:hypothetical protein
MDRRPSVGQPVVVTLRSSNPCEDRSPAKRRAEIGRSDRGRDHRFGDGGPAGWWGTAAVAPMTMYRDRPDYQGAKAMVYAILAVLFVVLAFALVRVRGRRAGRN